MKKKYREVHIEDESWKYVIDKASGHENIPIRIYDPKKKMYRLSHSDLSTSERNIEPSDIKKYIVDNLIK